MTRYEKKVEKYTKKAIRLISRKSRKIWRKNSHDIAIITVAAFLIVGMGALRPVIADEAPVSDQTPVNDPAPSSETAEIPPSDSSSETPDSTPEETPQETSQESEPTTIDTGDASSGVEIDNNVNTNTIETTDNATTTPPDDNSSSTPETIDLTIEGENNATTTNNATSTAETGANQASENPGDVIVDTGNAFAYADVVNIVNTNIVDSQGFFMLMNILSQFFGDIDFRNLGFEPLGNSACFEDACSVYNSLQISNLNYATTTNNVDVLASTGENITENNDGSTITRTGNAAAGANVVNVINTNIIDSNYLLVTINQFNGWIGDLVLPAKSFFQRLVSPFFGKALSLGGGLQSSSLEDGLVGYWPFDEDDLSGDTAFDRSGQGHDGTLVNGPAAAPGKIGQALDFDGSDDYVDVGNINSNANSISFWFSHETPINSESGTIFPIQTDTTNAGVLMGGSTSNIQNEIIEVRSNDESRLAWCSSSDTIPTGWHHLAATYDGTWYQIWLDGVEKDNCTNGSSQPSLTGGAVEIGRHQGFPSFDGLIDEVRIYNRALSADEIQKLYSGEGLTINNKNTADVQSNVSAEAETGENEANGNGGGATIETGNAASNAHVVNAVNTNLTGGTSIMILVRVYGQWNGNVFSTPPGVSWERTPGGLAIYGLDAESMLSSSFGKTIAVENENYGTVVNNVNVMALTGQNKANANGGSALIQTGSAAAGANVVNVVNTNVLGTNWILALINIFGDWNGNVAFGRPDLWVGSSVQAGNPSFEGGIANYNVTITNRGDTDATGVKLASQFNGELMFVENNGGGSDSSGSVEWDLGTLAPGATTNVSFSTKVGGSGLEPGTNTLENTFTATSYEPDGNPADNTDMVAFAAYKPPIIYTSGGGALVAASSEGTANLVIEKSYTGNGVVAPGSTIPFRITLKNKSGFSAYKVVVKDALKTSGGELVKENLWNLNEVFPNETINIDYELKIEDSAPAGVYTNQAFAFGEQVSGAAIESNTATSSFTVIGEIKPLETVKKLIAPPSAEAEMIIPRFAEYNPSETLSSPSFLASLLNLLYNFWVAIGALIILALIFFWGRRQNANR